MTILTRGTAGDKNNKSDLFFLNNKIEFRKINSKLTIKSHFCLNKYFFRK
jgi:glutamine synthetase type III